jgi:hypothetical protein
MADSILNSTKKVLGLAPDYTVFDQDVIMHLNSTFSILDQLGVGPTGGYSIEDDEPTWDAYSAPPNQLQMVRTYVFLKVRMLFDPPTTSYMITAMEQQIKEHEWRLNTFREVEAYSANVDEDDVPLVLDGGEL